MRETTKHVPIQASTIETTGLKCAPDTGAMTLMMTKRPAPMAKAFSRSSNPTSPGESDCAAKPDPTTTTINIVHRRIRLGARATRHRATSWSKVFHSALTSALPCGVVGSSPSSIASAVPFRSSRLAQRGPWTSMLERE